MPVAAHFALLCGLQSELHLKEIESKMASFVCPQDTTSTI